VAVHGCEGQGWAREEWDRLAAALNEYGIRHVSPSLRVDGPVALDPTGLFEALWRSPDARLQEATVPLLITWPDLAGAAHAAIRRLSSSLADRARRRYVAASAFQRMWRTRLQMALGARPLIPPAYVDELGLPSLDDDFGRATLLELARQEEALYGYNAWAGYTSLMDLVLQEIQLTGWGERAARAG
jgi:hypothetical protein